MSLLPATTDSCQQTHDATDRFSALFNTVLDASKLADSPAQCCKNQLGKLSRKLERSLEEHKDHLYQLQRHPSYSRHIIGRESNWTALLCRWEAGVCSSIHGHPAFTFYHVIDGQFTMDLYELNDRGQPKQTESIQLACGENYWQRGSEGRYDNMIHRVHARQHGFTIQLFSEDPSLGQVFH